jgi:hypothetical protein
MGKPHLLALVGGGGAVGLAKTLLNVIQYGIFTAYGNYSMFCTYSNFE